MCLIGAFLLGCGGGEGGSASTATTSPAAASVASTTSSPSSSTTSTTRAPTTSSSSTTSTSSAPPSSSTTTTIRSTTTSSIPLKADTGTVKIDQSTDLVPQRSTNLLLQKATINGVKYPDALLIYASCAAAQFIEINAGRHSLLFKGDFGVPDDQRSTDSYHLEISLDGGAPVYSAELAFGETKPVSLDIPGVLRVKVSVLSTSAQCGGNNFVGIGNPVLVS